MASKIVSMTDSLGRTNIILNPARETVNLLRSDVSELRNELGLEEFTGIRGLIMATFAADNTAAAQATYSTLREHIYSLSSEQPHLILSPPKLF